jgi:hypothetical protein
MKFPITKEQLQAYNEEEDRIENAKEDLEKGITVLLDRLLIDMRREMPMHYKLQCYVTWAIFENYERRDPRYFHRGNREWFLERYLARLQETFIGCKIRLDPSNMRVVIDWS